MKDMKKIFHLVLLLALSVSLVSCNKDKVDGSMLEEIWNSNRIETLRNNNEVVLVTCYEDGNKVSTMYLDEDSYITITENYYQLSYDGLEVNFFRDEDFEYYEAPYEVDTNVNSYYIAKAPNSEEEIVSSKKSFDKYTINTKYLYEYTNEVENTKYVYDKNDNKLLNVTIKQDGVNGERTVEYEFTYLTKDDFNDLLKLNNDKYKEVFEAIDKEERYQKVK